MNTADYNHLGNLLASQISTNPRDPLLGTTVDGRLEIRALLGRGGMGNVYEAFHIGLQTVVAVKILHAKLLANEGAVRRLQSEARLASALDHVNLVRTHAFGLIDGGVPYIVMEKVDGISLAEYLRDGGTFDKQTFVDVFEQCCAGLNEAHERGIIHRDITPANILLLSGTDRKWFVKITDFGIAKALTGEETGPMQRLTQTGHVLGTPAYMSPEQCQSGSLDHRSDIYSLGCVMYECITGYPPFASDNAHNCGRDCIVGNVRLRNNKQSAGGNPV